MSLYPPTAPMQNQAEKVPSLVSEARGRIGRLASLISVLEVRVENLLGPVPEVPGHDPIKANSSGTLVQTFEQYAQLPDLCDRLDRISQRLNALLE